MPIADVDPLVIHAGNGVATVFAYPFMIVAEADFKATIDGVLTTAYTLSGVGDESGGNCTFSTAPDNLAEIILYRDAAFNRTTDYQEGGDLLAETIDDDLDRIVMLCQQLKETLARVPTLALGSDLAGLLALTPEAGKFLAWGTPADEIVNVDISDISPGSVATTAYTQTLLDDANKAEAQATLGIDQWANQQGLINIGLSVSVAANALTVALKGWDGNDHSASNPGYVPFRAQTSPSGDTGGLILTAANSLTVPATATLGVTSADKAFRLWVALFNDAGNAELAIIYPVQRQAGGITEISRVQGQGISGATAIGTGSDSPTLWYGSASSSKPYTLLGYIEFHDGLAVPGVWDVAPDVVQVAYVGMPTPGMVIKQDAAQDKGMTTGTTQLPIDDTIPQITEGDEYLRVDLTLPNSSKCNAIRVSHTGLYASGNTDARIAAALFVTGQAAAVAVGIGERPATAHASAQVHLDYFDIIDYLPALPASMNIRAGTHSAGTTTFNGANGARLFGGAYTSLLIAEEIMA